MNFHVIVMSVHCFIFLESRNLMRERILIVDDLGRYKIFSILRQFNIAQGKEPGC